MFRRNVLLALAAIPLPACTSLTDGSNTISLSTVQAYVSDLTGAIGAAAQAFLAGPPKPSAANTSLVTSIEADLQTLNAAVQAAADAISVKSVVLEIITGVGQLSPLLTPLLGEAAAVLPLSLAVLQAFVADLPLPANASTTPPASLHKAALKFHHLK